MHLLLLLQIHLHRFPILQRLRLPDLLRLPLPLLLLLLQVFHLLLPLLFLQLLLLPPLLLPPLGLLKNMIHTRYS